MSLEMQNENELVMESMVPSLKEEKKVSKSLTMNEKRAMYGILSFLVIVNRDGILDDAKTQELMEHLPIFGTVAEKKVYLSQEMFDMSQLECEILKPMLEEHKQKKKQEKKKGKVSNRRGDSSQPKVEKVKVEKGESKPKKRVSKKKEKEVTDEGEVSVVVAKEEEVKVEKRVSKKKGKEMTDEGKVEKGESKPKKMGRKTKEQIVECKVDVNVNEGNSQEDQLAELVNQLVDNSKLEIMNPQDIEVDDLENLLSNIEKEEEETKVLSDTPRLPVPVPVPKEKSLKKKPSKKNQE